MEELIAKEEVNIKDMIYEVRGKQVMLDRDVANLYNYETKALNQCVKRNLSRFPENFCFQLTNDELINLWSQNVTANINKMSRTNPYVFTEYGIIMLSGLLKSIIAVEVNKRVVQAFVDIKKYCLNNNYNKRISNLETKYIEHDNKIDLILNRINNKGKNNHIFFEGQIYDAYSLLIDILNKSNKEIIIIDNYINKTLLDIASNINKNILFITSKVNNIDIEKYKSQYNNIKIKYSNIFHDRFIILDKKILYHCGASFKDLGKKCFSINLIEDIEYLNNLLEKINNGNF